jgi:hypothetical protein
VAGDVESVAAPYRRQQRFRRAHGCGSVLATSWHFG